MSVQDWKKIGFSDEEANELHKMAEEFVVNSYDDIDQATEELIKCMKEFELDLSDERSQEFIDKFNSIPEQYLVPNTYHGWKVTMGDKE